MTDGRRDGPGTPEEPSEQELVARLLVKALIDSRDDETGVRALVVKELFAAAGEGVWIEPPFYCDYGRNISVGRKVFLNFDCVILDVAPVRIGSGLSA